MTPRFTGDDTMNGSRVYTKFTSESGLTFALFQSLKNFSNLAIVQYAHGIGKCYGWACDVRPCFTSANFANGLRQQAVMISDFLVRVSTVAQIKDFKHLCFGQPRIAMLFTTASKFNAAIAHSALFCCISYVVSRCTKKQMIGANTSGDVTMMTNAQSVRDSAKVQFPTEAVYELGTSINSHLSVTEWHSASSPEPTSVGLVDLIPESYFGRWVGHICSPIKKSFAGIQAFVSSKRIDQQRTMKAYPRYAWMTNTLARQVYCTTEGGV